MKLTKTSVADLPLPASGQAFYFDDELPSFGVRVTSGGSKSYILDRRIGGKKRRITLGRANQIAPEQARTEARKKIGEILSGGDPVAAKRRQKLEGITLQAALDDYVATRDLKPRTVTDMATVFKRLLSSWLKKPITAITPEMVERKHRELGKASAAQADLCMRYLRAVLSYATARYVDASGRPIIVDNPVARLSRTKAWFRVERRRTLLTAPQLPAWYSAVDTLPGNVRDYLVFLLLTGLRGGEGAALRWTNVDLNARHFTVQDTKNRRPHTLPTSDYLQAMLERRHAARTNEYVFVGLHGKGHIRSADSAIRIVKAASGVDFCRHDLRRTFATTAESLDLPGYAVKRLLNHMDSGDVTQGYLVIDVERLRKPMQRITDALLAACGVREGAEVVAIGAAS